jgi:hypothetical protein
VKTINVTVESYEITNSWWREYCYIGRWRKQFHRSVRFADRAHSEQTFSVCAWRRKAGAL